MLPRNVKTRRQEKGSLHLHLLDVWLNALFDPDGGREGPGYAFLKESVECRSILDEPILTDGIVKYFMSKGGPRPYERLYHHVMEKCLNFQGEPSSRGQLLGFAVLCRAISFQSTTAASC